MSDPLLSNLEPLGDFACNVLRNMGGQILGYNNQAQLFWDDLYFQAFEDVLALLIYGLVLFPNPDSFVDVNAIKIFLSRNPGLPCWVISCMPSILISCEEEGILCVACRCCRGGLFHTSLSLCGRTKKVWVGPTE